MWDIKMESHLLNGTYNPNPDTPGIDDDNPINIGDDDLPNDSRGGRGFFNFD